MKKLKNLLSYNQSLLKAQDFNFIELFNMLIINKFKYTSKLIRKKESD